MPKPVLLIECTCCASLWLLTLAARRELLGLPVEYRICPAHRAEREAEMFALDMDEPIP